MQETSPRIFLFLWPTKHRDISGASCPQLCFKGWIRGPAKRQQHNGNNNDNEPRQQSHSGSRVLFSTFVTIPFDCSLQHQTKPLRVLNCSLCCFVLVKTKKCRYQNEIKWPWCSKDIKPVFGVPVRISAHWNRRLGRKPTKFAWAAWRPHSHSTIATTIMWTDSRRPPVSTARPKGLFTARLAALAFTLAIVPWNTNVVLAALLNAEQIVQHKNDWDHFPKQSALKLCCERPEKPDVFLFFLFCFFFPSNKHDCWKKLKLYTSSRRIVQLLERDNSGILVYKIRRSCPNGRISMDYMDCLVCREVQVELTWTHS